MPNLVLGAYGSAKGAVGFQVCVAQNSWRLAFPSGSHFSMRLALLFLSAQFVWYLSRCTRSVCRCQLETLTCPLKSCFSSSQEDLLGFNVGRVLVRAGQFLKAFWQRQPSETKMPKPTVAAAALWVPQQLNAAAGESRGAQPRQAQEEHGRSALSSSSRAFRPTW